MAEDTVESLRTTLRAVLEAMPVFVAERGGGHRFWRGDLTEDGMKALAKAETAARAALASPPSPGGREADGSVPDRDVVLDAERGHDVVALAATWFISRTAAGSSCRRRACVQACEAPLRQSAPERVGGAVSAVLSADGKYRYILTREMEPLAKPQRSLTWVMLNPSTADAEKDDPTIRRVRSFSLAWGATRFAVVNLYAFRATKPADLPASMEERHGPEWEYWTTRAIGEADGVMFAWGAHPSAVEGAAALEALYLQLGKGIMCLGRTKHGAPRHPLYVLTGTSPEPYYRVSP